MVGNIFFLLSFNLAVNRLGVNLFYISTYVRPTLSKKKILKLISHSFFFALYFIRDIVGTEIIYV